MSIREVAEACCELQDLVDALPREHPMYETFHRILLRALDQLAEYVIYCRRDRESADPSARYWLTQGEGSQLPSGMRMLVRSVKLELGV